MSEPEIPASLPPSPPPEVGRLRRILTWVRSHKIRTLVLTVVAFLLIELATIPWFSIGRLKTENPSDTALMRQRISEAEDRGKSLRIVQRWVSLSRVPQHVTDAIVVAEDGTFFSHSGFDWFEVQQSLERNWKEKKAARGASTITQQVAKNLFLSTSKDPVRKAKEALITLLLEQQLTKERILEIYLNIIEWGPGVFGIEAAARAYFGKSASALSVEEGARLAAVIPSPLRHRPDTDSRYVLRRKQIVLNRMAARRMTTTEVPDQEFPEEEPEEDSVAPQPLPISPVAPEQLPAAVPDTLPAVPDTSGPPPGASHEPS
jgi:monofunctional biosynthetic peptidoglycan transglycosylase